MTPKSEFGSRVKFFFWKFSLEMIEFILIRNPNEILRVKLSKLGFHFQNFNPYKKRPLGGGGHFRYFSYKIMLFSMEISKIDQKIINNDENLPIFIQGLGGHFWYFY